MEKAQYCTSCGIRLNASDRFCPQCGTIAGDYQPREDGTKSQPDNFARTADASSAASVSAALQASEEGLAEPRPWARWAAKTIDITIFALPAGFVAAVLAGDAVYNDPPRFQLYLFLVFALTFPFGDALSVALSGGSIGRAVFRFSILRDGEKPLFSKALGRAWGSWIRGMGFGIPIVTLFTQFGSYDFLKRNGRSAWDVDAETTVVHRGPKWWSWLIFWIVVVVNFALFMYERSQQNYY